MSGLVFLLFIVGCVLLGSIKQIIDNQKEPYDARRQLEIIFHSYSKFTNICFKSITTVCYFTFFATMNF